MNIKNPLYDQNGRFVWDKFFSYFGGIFALLAFFAIGLFFEMIGNALWPIDATLASQSHLFVIGGTLGFTIAIVLIYGLVCGFSLIPLVWLFLINPQLASVIAFGLFASISFAGFTRYEPPFRRVFWNWVRSRETPKQNRIA